MPRFSTCMPSGTCVAVTSRPAMNAGPRMLHSSALQFMSFPRVHQPRDRSSKRPNRSLRLGAADGERQLTAGCRRSGSATRMAAGRCRPRSALTRRLACSLPAPRQGDARRRDTRLRLEHHHLLHAQPLVQVDVILVLDAPQCPSGAACSSSVRIACASAPGNPPGALRVLGRVARSSCCSRRPSAAAISAILRGSSWMCGLPRVNVALRAIELAGHVEPAHEVRRGEVAGQPRLYLGVCPTAAAASAASRSRVRRRCRPPVPRCARARSGWAAPVSGADPAARWWRPRHCRFPPSSFTSAPHSGSQANTLSAACAEG